DEEEEKEERGSGGGGARRGRGKEHELLRLKSADGLAPFEEQIKKMIASYVGENAAFEKQYLSGQLEVELIPQVRRRYARFSKPDHTGRADLLISSEKNNAPFRALSPSGAAPEEPASLRSVRRAVSSFGGALFEAPLPHPLYAGFRVDSRHRDGVRHADTHRWNPGQVLSERQSSADEQTERGESGLRPSVVRTADCRAGRRRLTLRRPRSCQEPHVQRTKLETARNFNPVMATAGKITIAEVDEILPVGGISPADVHLPGVYVHRVVRAKCEKRIERLMLSDDEAGAAELSDADRKRERVVRRAAREFKNGILAGGRGSVNLGIGMPMLASNYIAPGVVVHLQSENGLLGLGPVRRRSLPILET
ncbi:MAG: hypothetical protein BJ554DRAFT_4455, partial [Olpidium bornovanus]